MSDKIIRATDKDNYFRFFIIKATDTVEKIRTTHNASKTATAALGRLSIMAQIIGYDLKSDTDTVTLKIKGGGPAGNLIAVANNKAIVKSLMGNPYAEVPPKSDTKLDVGGLVGKNGTLSVVRDYGLKEPWIGVSDLVSGEIAEDFANYFAISEQQPSVVSLGVYIEDSVKSAGGLLIQPLPFCPEEQIVKMENTIKDLPAISTIMKDKEPEDVLKEFFKDFDINILQVDTPKYECDCNMERIEKALISLGREELLDIADNDHKADVKCDFCNKEYNFDEKELKELAIKAVAKTNINIVDNFLK